MGGRLPDVANAHGAVFLKSRHVWPILHALALLGCSRNYPSAPLKADEGILSCIAHLAPLHLFGSHDDNPGVLLKHHPPEITDGVLQTALSSDVALPPLGAVALHVQLRLHVRMETVCR